MSRDNFITSDPGLLTHHNPWNRIRSIQGLTRGATHRGPQNPLAIAYSLRRKTPSIPRYNPIINLTQNPPWDDVTGAQSGGVDVILRSSMEK